MESLGPPPVSVTLDVEPWLLGQGLIPELRARGFGLRAPAMGVADIAVKTPGGHAQGLVTVEIGSGHDVKVNAFGRHSVHAVESLGELADLLDQFVEEIRLKNLGGDAI